MSENQDKNNSGVVIDNDHDDVLNSTQVGTNVSFKKILLFMAVALILISGSIFGGFSYIKSQFGWGDRTEENYRTRRSYEQAPEGIGRYTELPPLTEPPAPPPQIEETEDEEIAVLETPPPIVIEQQVEQEQVSDEPSLATRRLSSNISGYSNVQAPVEDIPNLQVKLLDKVDYTLIKGTKIPCIMESNIVSEQNGFTSCIVSQDVYSANARILLIEKGTKVTGEYQSSVKNGDRRLQVIWDRLITPYDIVVQLNSPTTDRLGASGVTGEVDNRWGLRVGSALLVSLMSDAISIAGERTEKGSGAQVFVESETSDTSKRLAERILEKNIDLNPIIYIREGEMINIYVSDDIDLSEVYNVRDLSSNYKRNNNPALYYK